jgi:DNA-binding transcriptional LysR family regulator
MHDAMELFPAASANPERPLRLGLGCSLHLSRAGRLIADFRDECPEVDLGLADVDEVCASDALQREDMDAAILIGGATPLGLRSAGLWREPLIAALPGGHPLAAARAIDPVALRAETIPMAGCPQGQAGLKRAVLGARGGPSSAFVWRHVERDTLLDLVALNFGVALAPGVAAGASHPGVCFRPIAATSAPVAYRLLWKPNNRNPVLHAFARFARAFGRRREPAFESGID